MITNKTSLLRISAPIPSGAEGIFSDEAMAFVEALHKEFNERRLELLNLRIQRQKEIDMGRLPDFLPETESVRNGGWKAAPVPEVIADRRVEITGPVDRKMIINALNSGANVYMADFEDANSPTWTNVCEGQVNLYDAVRRQIEYTSPEGKLYQLKDELAVLFVRPRGLHLPEKHIRFGSQYASGALVDFGFYFFHNAHKAIESGLGPFFYLPKLESHLEARWWNDVFVFSQKYLGIPQGTIKATVLIETILATFEADEIIYELREHSAGLNCGRWDYIFSYIKKLRNHKGYVLPDRSLVTMETPFMDAYSRYVVQVCHKRGVHAMGGMSAFIPVKGKDQENIAAFEKVKQDKLREVKNGHDGTWVAHPALVSVAREVFDQYMPGPNQISSRSDEQTITAAELLSPPKLVVTEKGIRHNINVALLYIESWLNGVGAAALYNLMEDAATAEISRAQLWQWLRNKVVTEEGTTFNELLYQKFKSEELQKIRKLLGDDRFENGRFKVAEGILDQLVLEEEFVEFLTLPAYEFLP
ncbi:malate synthase A [Schleiferia thermophila]|jgi:malate synthase|uniref:malate synthase A n=1 Tax=Schleiferia thermophila TaxID=884107 RepID=UPI000563AAA2|nr:malate synthase A [Schleiferia thermophila]